MPCEHTAEWSHIIVVAMVYCYGLIPQPPLQRRGGAVLSLMMFTTIAYCSG